MGEHTTEARGVGGSIPSTSISKMKKRKKVNKKIILSLIIVIAVIIFFVYLYINTGFLQKSIIDSRDLENWNYNDNGEIIGTNEFAELGQSNKCWILIHGYTSTPQEMRQLARSIRVQFDELSHAVKLEGHGEVPSNLLDKNLSIWYNQVEIRYDSFDGLCGEMNVVGSSLGTVLALRLAEERNV